jgi:N-acetylglucosaminyldiphosphoundecaprenol N-acetyl-beta-D-mannosaminyltransferase
VYSKAQMTGQPNTPRHWLGTLPVDALTRREFLEAIDIRLRDGVGGTVFTPNVDHIVRAERDAAFRDAYQTVTYSLADGMPLVWVSKLAAAPLPERLSGSDLFWPLLDTAIAASVPVYLLGGRIGAAQRVAELTKKRSSAAATIRMSEPTQTLIRDAQTLAEAGRAIAALGPALVLVSLPSPQQEIWTQAARAIAPQAVFACLGSAVDIAAGMVTRAPQWMQRSGLEWAFRVGSEPRRLWKRYALGFIHFAPIAAREIRRPKA